MKKQKLAILGSTGSIGTQALEIVRQHSEKFEVIALSANSNWKLLAEQVREFNPEYTLIVNESHAKDLEKECTETKVLSGSEHLSELASLKNVDTVLNALVGYAGFE